MSEVDPSDPNAFAREIARRLLAVRSHLEHAGRYELTDVTVDGRYPTAKLIIRFRAPTGSGDFAWRYPVFADADDEDETHELDWDRWLKRFPMYQNIDAFLGQLAVDLDEGIAGACFKYGPPDDHGTRWVVTVRGRPA